MTDKLQPFSKGVCCKCLSEEVSATYCRGGENSSCQSYKDFHLHRECQTCQFAWAEYPADAYDETSGSSPRRKGT